VALYKSHITQLGLHKLANKHLKLPKINLQAHFTLIRPSWERVVLT